jgi:endonuclease YncB( thermonuclease family)
MMLRFLNHGFYWLLIILLAGCQQENQVSQSTDEEASAATQAEQSGELTAAELADSAQGEVVGVHDGDTCTLLVGKDEYKIRLEGIDTPELGQAFGKNAKQALSNYVFGKEVTARISGQDRYQRYLGTLLVDGQNVNLQLVKDGCAWHYKDYSSDEALAAAETAARSAGLGLWQDAAAVAPWQWRRKGSKKSTGKKSTNSGKSAKDVPADVSHWLNPDSGIRHNRTCHQFGKSKQGRGCGPRDGRACKVCGG